MGLPDYSIARRAYRQLLEEGGGLENIRCDLVDELPEALLAGVDLAELPLALEECPRLGGLWRDMLPEKPSGGLQLFWRSLMFCRGCSLRLCREFLLAGRQLEACPVQRF